MTEFEVDRTVPNSNIKLNGLAKDQSEEAYSMGICPFTVLSDAIFSSGQKWRHVASSI